MFVFSGEVLKGDRIVDTAFDLRVLTDEDCKMQCSGGKALDLSQNDASLFAERIEEEYSIQLSVDNLPCATPRDDDLFEPGYKIGYADTTGTYLYNHLSIRIKYHAGELREDDMQAAGGSDGVFIVGCELQPRSVAHDSLTVEANQQCSVPDSARPQKVEPESKGEFSESRKCAR